MQKFLASLKVPYYSMNLVVIQLWKVSVFGHFCCYKLNDMVCEFRCL